MGLIIHGSFHGNILKNNFSFICFETSKLTVEKKGNFTLESSCVPLVLYGIIDDKFVNFLF